MPHRTPEGESSELRRARARMERVHRDLERLERETGGARGGGTRPPARARRSVPPARILWLMIGVLLLALLAALLGPRLLPGGHALPAPSPAPAGTASGPYAHLEEGGPATLERVVDGDTIIVRLGSERVRVRLLNIDTPETVHPDREVECLGPEASAFLTERIPAGTALTLRYDAERMDRYGRLLAGVYGPDGALLNAEIARAGLGIPVQYGRNARFLPEVEAARAEAQQAERGLYARDLACVPTMR